MDANSTISLSCEDGMSLVEDEIYVEIAWWLEGVVHLVISVLGLFANSISMIVMLSSAFNNVFNRTLAGLAFFDGVFNLCDILETIRKIYYDFRTCAPWNYFKMAHIYIFPKFLYPLHKIAMTTSMYTTVVLAFNRYYAVSQPIHVYVNTATGTTKRVLINIILVLLFAFVFNLPKFFEFYVEWCTFGCMNQMYPNTQMLMKEYDKDNETIDEFKAKVYEFGVRHLVATNGNSTPVSESQINQSNIHLATKLHFHWNPFRLNHYYTLIYINVAQNLVTGFIPLLLLAILNFYVYLHLRKRRKEVSQLTKAESRSTIRSTNNGLDSIQKSQATRSLEAENRRQAQTLFGVVALFALSHVFRVVLNVHEIYLTSSFNGKLGRGCASNIPFWTHVMGTIQRVLLAISHSGNLAIYCISSRKFRSVLGKKIFGFLRRNEEETFQMDNLQLSHYITAAKKNDQNHL